MGCNIRLKAYRLFNTRSNKFILSCDVRFNEMHIGLDFESGVSFLEHNTTKEKEIGPNVFSFQ